MISALLSDKNLRLFPDWSWGAVSFGFSKGFLNARQVRQVAAIIAEGSPSFADDARVIQLLEAGESDPILHLLDSLTADASPTAEGVTDFWAGVTLVVLGSNINLVTDPLGVIEAMYSELDYPKLMAQFVRYMPHEGSNSEGDIVNRLEDFAKQALG
jgi:hypothetical protein